MNLQRKVTGIGELDLRIIGGIEYGVKYENRKEILEGIKFHKVSKVDEVIKLLFV